MTHINVVRVIDVLCYEFRLYWKVANIFFNDFLRDLTDSLVYPDNFDHYFSCNLIMRLYHFLILWSLE